jgi:hypothetical protein
VRNSQKNQVRHLIKEEFDSRTVTSTGAVLPIGYNPLEYIRGGLFHWVQVPFNSTGYWCELRCPNAVQLQACGDITNIVGDEKPENYTLEQKLEIRNLQEKICKIVLNRPAYNEIASLVGKNDFVLSEKQKQLDSCESRYNEAKKSLPEIERKIIEAEIETLKLELGYFLPFDTMDFLTGWGMGNDVSQVKTITKGMFLQAASLAKASNKSPSDFLSGVFTDFNKAEINAHAFIVLEEYLKEKEIVDNAKHVWLGAARNKHA